MDALGSLGCRVNSRGRSRLRSRLPAKLSPKQVTRASDLGDIPPVQEQKNGLGGLAEKNLQRRGRRPGLSQHPPEISIASGQQYASKLPRVTPNLRRQYFLSTALVKRWSSGEACINASRYR